MGKVKMINAEALPNIPWQEKPTDLVAESPVWRYSENPVMGRNPTPEIARIFNSAVVPWEDGFIAVLRGEQINGVPYVYLGHSKDGIHWDVEREKVPFTDEAGNPKMPHYAYDPRLVKVEDTYYMISKPLPGLRIPLFLSTGTQYCFPEKSAEPTACFPVRRTADTRPSAMSLSARVRI